MEEIWKEIDGFNGDYWVSNLGRVKSLKYKKERILRHGITSGYKRVILSVNNIPKGYSVHRLVANAFIPNPNNYPCVNHKDENKTNNCVDNLEWCTREYNQNYGTVNKRRARFKSKKVLQFKTDGTFVKEWESARDVQRMTGYDNSHISKCCRNILKSAHGYIWRYKKEMD